MQRARARKVLDDHRRFVKAFDDFMQTGHNLKLAKVRGDKQAVAAAESAFDAARDRAVAARIAIG